MKKRTLTIWLAAFARRAKSDEEKSRRRAQEKTMKEKSPLTLSLPGRYGRMDAAGSWTKEAAKFAIGVCPSWRRPPSL